MQFIQLDPDPTTQINEDPDLKPYISCENAKKSFPSRTNCIRPLKTKGLYDTDNPSFFNVHKKYLLKVLARNFSKVRRTTVREIFLIVLH